MEGLSERLEPFFEAKEECLDGPMPSEPQSFSPGRGLRHARSGRAPPTLRLLAKNNRRKLFRSAFTAKEVG